MHGSNLASLTILQTQNAIMDCGVNFQQPEASAAQPGTCDQGGGDCTTKLSLSCWLAATVLDMVLSRFVQRGSKSIQKAPPRIAALAKPHSLQPWHGGVWLTCNAHNASAKTWPSVLGRVPRTLQIVTGDQLPHAMDPRKQQI